jgi:hypothetical protein
MNKGFDQQYRRMILNIKRLEEHDVFKYLYRNVVLSDETVRQSTDRYINNLLLGLVDHTLYRAPSFMMSTDYISFALSYSEMVGDLYDYINNQIGKVFDAAKTDIDEYERLRADNENKKLLFGTVKFCCANFRFKGRVGCCKS